SGRLGLIQAGVGDEVAGRQAQLAEQVEDLLELAGFVPAEAELGRHQVPGGPLHPLPAPAGSRVARSTTSRPASVISARRPRPSEGFGLRITSCWRSRRSMVLVTLVGCTISRAPITPSGSAPRRLKVSRTSAS